MILPKKVKQEQEQDISCRICSVEFKTELECFSHMQFGHVPQIDSYGCASCGESFLTEDENKTHHDWHNIFNIPYRCFKCTLTFDRLLSFSKHLSKCIVFTTNHPYVDIIVCQQCHTEFATKNLYDWHQCFIRNNSKCPKCQKLFTKRMSLFKHLFKCEVNSKIVVQIPRSSASLQPITTAFMNVKREPEAILDSVLPPTSLDSRHHDDDQIMDVHFNDCDDSSSDNDQQFNASHIQATKTKETTPAAADSIELIKECRERIVQVALQNVAVQPGLSDIYSSVIAKGTDLSGTAGKKSTNRRAHFKAPSTSSEALVVPSIRIKTEPIDYNEYPLHKQAHADAQRDQPCSRVVTFPAINIKKEIVHPGDTFFDPEVARNIKRERDAIDGHQPRIPALRLKIRKQHGALNATLIGDAPDSTMNEKNPGKLPTTIINSDHQLSQKVYKKPALLAIKIKQEREERELSENIPDDRECVDESYNYMGFGEQSTDMDVVNETAVVTDVRLPVIAEVSSAVEIPATNIVVGGNVACDADNSLVKSGCVFTGIIPIKIKLERQTESNIVVEPSGDFLGTTELKSCGNIESNQETNNVSSECNDTKEKACGDQINKDLIKWNERKSISDCQAVVSVIDNNVGDPITMVEDSSKGNCIDIELKNKSQQQVAADEKARITVHMRVKQDELRNDGENIAGSLHKQIPNQVPCNYPSNEINFVEQNTKNEEKYRNQNHQQNVIRKVKFNCDELDAAIDDVNGQHITDSSRANCASSVEINEIVDSRIMEYVGTSSDKKAESQFNSQYIPITSDVRKSGIEELSNILLQSVAQPTAIAESPEKMVYSFAKNSIHNLVHQQRNELIASGETTNTESVPTSLDTDYARMDDLSSPEQISTVAAAHHDNLGSQLGREYQTTELETLLTSSLNDCNLFLAVEQSYVVNENDRHTSNSEDKGIS